MHIRFRINEDGTAWKAMQLNIETSFLTK